MEDAPAEAIRLAAAELSLRVNEERRRRGVGLGCISNLKYERMTGKPGEVSSFISFLYTQRWFEHHEACHVLCSALE